MIARPILTICVVTAGALLIACGTGGAPGAGQTPTRPPSALPTATPPPGATPPPLSIFDLKYRLLDAFPAFFFCDPDYYPVAHADEMQLALERFPAIQSDTAEFSTIIARLGLPSQDLSDAQKLAVYREHKKLAALALVQTDEGFAYDLRTSTDGSSGSRVRGTITDDGRVSTASTEPAIVTCPICLARGALIDTPNGAVAVEEIRPGDPIWSVDAAGNRVATVVARVGATLTGPGHEVVTVTLDDGRTVTASPGHPVADGRPIGELRPGDRLDGSVVAATVLAPYRAGATYDVLPAGETGIYLAGGIPVRSTLTGTAEY